MLFLLNGKGELQRLDNDRVFQGSNNATKLGVIYPYAGVSLAASFTLPNGITTNYTSMPPLSTYTLKNGGGDVVKTFENLFYTSIPIPNTVTALQGVCKVTVAQTAVSGTGAAGSIDPAQVDVNTSYSANFTVEYAALPVYTVPDDPTEADFQKLVELLEAYKGTISGNVTELQKRMTTAEGNIASLGERVTTAEGNISALQSGLATANGKIAANAAAIEGNSADIAALQEDMSAAQSDIAEVQDKTASPLMTDWTVNVANNMAVNSYNNGTTRYVSFPTPAPSGAQRITFATAVSFTADDFVQQEDGTYTLTLTATQTARTNNLFTANLEVTDGTGYAVSADCFVKNADGSVTISGIGTPFAGRLITITAGQNGTVWHYGTAIVGTGTQTSTDLALRASVLVGDFYLNTETSQYYICTGLPENASTWLYLANLQGAKGEKGDAGAPFAIYKTYVSIAAMNADAENVPDGRFVLIETGNVDDEDNSKLYVRTVGGAADFQFVTDLSGAQGIKGDNGTTFTPSVDTNGNLSWTNDGGLPNPTTVNIKGQKGDAGDAATIQIGAVTTLPAGSQATVENVGTPTAAMFNFGIPQGAQGEKGGTYVAQIQTSNGEPLQVTAEQIAQNTEFGISNAQNWSAFSQEDIALVNVVVTDNANKAALVIMQIDAPPTSTLITGRVVYVQYAASSSGGGLTVTTVVFANGDNFVTTLAPIYSLTQSAQVIAAQWTNTATVEVTYTFSGGATAQYMAFLKSVNVSANGELLFDCAFFPTDPSSADTFVFAGMITALFMGGGYTLTAYNGALTNQQLSEISGTAFKINGDFSLVLFSQAAAE